MRRKTDEEFRRTAVVGIPPRFVHCVRIFICEIKYAFSFRTKVYLHFFFKCIVKFAERFLYLRYNIDI